jgi:Zn-dependent protease
MFPSKFRICDVFGIPVYLDLSLIVLIALFVWESKSPTFGLACAMVLALSITLHELGHALTARAFGYQTRDITLSLLGGCASLIGMPRKASQEFLVALAGPLVSFVLAGAGLVSLLYLPIENDWLSEVVKFVFWMNLILGAFNLLPGFPMDGGRIFRSVVRIFTTRVKATYAAMVVGRVFAVLLALRGLHSIFTGGGWGVISLLIAWMIWREGWREYVQAAQEERWGSPWEYSARVSPPPYSDDEDDEVEVRKK